LFIHGIFGVANVQTAPKVSLTILFFLAFTTPSAPQEKGATPAVELLDAARLADVRVVAERSFKIQANIKLEQGKGVVSQGSYVLLWGSPTQWHEEFSFPDFHQVRVSGPGGVWERREPYFLSLPMWQIMQALSFYGRFKLQGEESAGKIKRSKKNGEELRCIEIARHSPVREFCFHEDVPQLASEHYLPSDRHYEYADYRTIGTKFFPGRITVFDGKTLAAEFVVSNVGETPSASTSLFEQPARAEWRPWCASPDVGGDPLTPIYSRLTQNKGVATLYGTIGTDGQWHGVHVLESGGQNHDAKVLEALKKERWEPSSCNGTPIPIETVFRR
jgi:hypothetical protein